MNAQCGLNFHAHGRVRPLHIGSSANQAVHIRGGFAGGFQCLLAGQYANFGHHGNLAVRTRRKARTHTLGVQNALLFHDVAALYAGGFFDELDARFSQCAVCAGGNCIGMQLVFQRGVVVIGLHQLFVANGVRRCKQACAADSNAMHRFSLIFGSARAQGL